MAAGIRLLLVDALNLVRRVYAAQPGEDGPEKARSGLESTLRSLRRALAECRPTHIAAVFDGSGTTWRHRRFPGYKAGRPPMPAPLGDALPAFREAFAQMGIPSFDREGTEADDVIATLAVKVAQAGGRAAILSTDKSYLQLLSEAVRVRDHFRQRNLGPENVRERFGVGPDRLLDLLALAGDSTSSIPGVPGVGSKTAAKLLADWGSLDAVLAAARASPAAEPREGPRLTPRLRERLVAHADDARLARRLFELVTDLELGLNLSSLRYSGPAGDFPGRPDPRSAPGS